MVFKPHVRNTEKKSQQFPLLDSSHGLQLKLTQADFLAWKSPHF